MGEFMTGKEFLKKFGSIGSTLKHYLEEWSREVYIEGFYAGLNSDDPNVVNEKFAEWYKE